MKTEQEIRTEAVKECIKKLTDARNSQTYFTELGKANKLGRDTCIEILKDLLPLERVSDEKLAEQIEFLKDKEDWDSIPYNIGFIRNVLAENQQFRTAKAEPYQWKKGDIVRLKKGCNGIFEGDYFQTHDGTIEKITNTEDEGIHVRGIVDKVYLHFCRPQDLRLVKSVEPEKAEASLVDKIKARCEKGLSAPASNDYNKGWDNCSRIILDMISEASNEN